MDPERHFAADLGARARAGFAAVLAVTSGFATVTYADAFADRPSRDKAVGVAVILTLWVAAMVWASWATSDDRLIDGDPNLASWPMAVALTLLTAGFVAGPAAVKAGVVRSEWKGMMAFALLTALAGFVLAYRAAQTPAVPAAVRPPIAADLDAQN